ncbi:methyltransferase [Microbacterium soli]|uniref:Putative 4-hydroxy-4-methyl-2-oxoglutarate aldolase n=1 Tax=Microbacterium soli TaxID=446075 RepID=A0ABP7NBT6_9MICO
MIERWDQVPSSAASDCQARFGAMRAEIRNLTGFSVTGPAHTIRIQPGDSLSLHRELEHVGAGSVLIIDAGGVESRAVWGELLTEAAIAQGIAGVVIDGAVRDIARIQERGFPLFARAVTPSGPVKSGGGNARVPISCGGVTVAQGDRVVGDRDGVTVVPAAQESQVFECVKRVVEQERQWAEAIRQGRRTTDLLGLDDGRSK